VALCRPNARGLVCLDPAINAYGELQPAKPKPAAARPVGALAASGARAPSVWSPSLPSIRQLVPLQTAGRQASGRGCRAPAARHPRQPLVQQTRSSQATGFSQVCCLASLYEHLVQGASIRCHSSRTVRALRSRIDPVADESSRPQLLHARPDRLRRRGLRGQLKLNDQDTGRRWSSRGDNAWLRKRHDRDTGRRWSSFCNNARFLIPIQATSG